MRRNTFIALAAVTAVAVVGAVVAVEQRDEAIRQAPARAALYPGLLGQVNDVTQLVIRSAEGTITLAHEGDRWVMRERNDYPADFEKIRETLLRLARIETVDPRTSRPELYDKLQVEDIDAPDAKSVEVVARVGDEPVADLIVGRARPADEGGGLFVRRAGEEQAWLAAGELHPDRHVADWLDRNIVNVDQRRVKTVTIAHPDGDRVTVAKAGPAPGDYRLESPVPEGREPKPPHELSALPSITDFLILEDVRPAAELDFSQPAATAAFETYDGLRLVLDAVERDGQTWVRVQADRTEPAADAAAFVEANKGKDSADGRAADQFKTAEAVAAEVEAINARTAGWAYRLTDYKTDKVRTRTADVTQEIAKADAGQGETAAPAPDTAPQTVN